ncbi:MAG: hypothetical protein ACK5PF_07115, partial [bacterium]
MDEILIFCGDVERPPSVDDNTILLDVAAAKSDPARVQLRAEEITRKMLGTLAARLAVRVVLACYVS